MVIQQGQGSFVDAPETAHSTRRPGLTVVRPDASAATAQRGEQPGWERRFAGYLRMTDALVVSGAVLMAQYARFGSTPAAEGLVTRYETLYSAVLIAIWLAALAGMRTRSSKHLGAGIEEYRRVV